MHIVLLDINNLLCRSYFAYPKQQIADIEVGGIIGLFHYINNLCNILQPTHIAAARDLPYKTFRHRLYPEYKQHRPKSEPELVQQFKLLPLLARYMKIMLLDQQGYEADDCLAAIARHTHATVTIVSTDKDLWQLLEDRIRIYNPATRSLITRNYVEDRYCIPFARLLDYCCIVGDGSDNIPGLIGLGPKGAQEIVRYSTTLADVQLHRLKPAVAKKFNEQYDQIPLMRTLLTLATDMPLALRFDECTAAYFTYYPNIGNLDAILIAQWFNAVQNEVWK